MCKSQCSNKRCSLWSEECEWRMCWHYGFQINIFQLQSKWVADYNLSNHLERKRFGAFCQLVCTKCHQCAKANAATNVAPFGVKNASKGWFYSTIFKSTYFNIFCSTFSTKTNFQNVSNSIFQLIFYCAAFFVKWHHISCIYFFFKHFHFYFLCYHNILSIGNKIINICHNGLKMYPEWVRNIYPRLSITTVDVSHKSLHLS